MTYAAFGSPRVVVSCCKTISRSAVTAEAAGSSPVVPAIHSNHLRKVGLSVAGTKRNNKKVHFPPPAAAV